MENKKRKSRKHFTTKLRSSVVIAELNVFFVCLLVTNESNESDVIIVFAIWMGVGVWIYTVTVYVCVVLVSGMFGFLALTLFTVTIQWWTEHPKEKFIFFMDFICANNNNISHNIEITDVTREMSDKI